MINLLFSAFPYVALAVLGGGLLVRYVLTYRRIAAVSAEASHAWAVFGGGKVWRTSFVLLAAAHLAGMAFPKAILLWNGASVRLLLLEATGFLAGLMAVIGCAGVMRRHLQRSGASVVGELGDCLLVALMFVGLLSGLLTAVFYRWGSSWSAVTIAPYLTSVFQGAPLTALIERMPRLVQLHVLSGFAMLVVFPFTRASSFAMLGMQRAIAFVMAPVYAASKLAGEWAEQRNLTAWLWPEEEAIVDYLPENVSRGVEAAATRSRNVALEAEPRPSGFFHTIQKSIGDSLPPVSGVQANPRTVSTPPAGRIKPTSRRSNNPSRKDATKTGTRRG